MVSPTLVALDLEGVLLEEVWLAIAERTGLQELRLTTRDFSDYSKLMEMRLSILRRHSLTLSFLQEVIRDSVVPLEGAQEFLDWLRCHTPVVILSDIFVELVAPVQHKLGFPTIFGNTLTIDSNSGEIEDFHIRQDDGKRKAIEAFQKLGFRTFAAGDSYNDLSMIRAAENGTLFKPPRRIREEASDLHCCDDFAELKSLIEKKLLSPV